MSDSAGGGGWGGRVVRKRGRRIFFIFFRRAEKTVDFVESDLFFPPPSFNHFWKMKANFTVTHTLCLQKKWGLLCHWGLRRRNSGENGLVHQTRRAENLFGGKSGRRSSYRFLLICKKQIPLFKRAVLFWCHRIHLRCVSRNSPRGTYTLLRPPAGPFKLHWYW